MFKFNIKNIPNYLTILRLIFIPIIFSLILLGKYNFAFIFFVLASISDILDGQIARKYHFITDWGKLMDPLADKLTQISTLTALIIKNIIPFWILVILTIKELIMISVGFILYKNNIMTVHSKWYGKLATVLFFVAIVFSLLSEHFVCLQNIKLLIYYLALSITLFASIMYGKDIFLKKFKVES